MNNINFINGLEVATQVLENTNERQDTVTDLIELVHNSTNEDFKSGIRKIYGLFISNNEEYIKTLNVCYSLINSYSK